MKFIANGRDLFRYQGQFGDPTSFLLGLTSDTDGNLYVCVYMGGVALKIDRK